MTKAKKLLAVALICGGGFLFWLLAPAGGVPILAYHMVDPAPEVYSVDPAAFEEQMRYLAREGYTAISLAELLDGLAGKRALPAKPIVITFDDGYRDNYTVALPILEKYNFKATVFVIAGQVGRSGYLTWEEIKDMQRRHVEIGSHTLSHAALTALTLPERQREIGLSKQMLERHLGTPVEFLAYPYGKFDPALFPLLQEAGYRGACSGIAGLNFQGDNAYRLKRVNIPRPRYGLWEFKLRLLRAHIYAKLGI
ncbi:polysaccharide deacetylase family protein [Sporolituus thermophilus]|uniref:Polysaccharide deacetylase n=1 Tax=Sporolituus thermophilus DSM 23256 TaxID=1123285 RepID=A0A1G7N5M8_9FIRM|nr:polysaccharide deacetylase family protein [Sporolituus thermophilus]SDF68630.1 Polysaccharide deacetylase [Sporolituus thermophilus DSM 23256]